MSKKRNKINQLISRSVYAFDLDKRLLQIKDADMFVARKDIICDEGFIIKTVNPDLVVERAYIQLMASSCTSIDQALESRKAPVSKRIAHVSVDEGKVILNIIKPLTVKENTSVLFRLDYNVPLTGDSPELFFCGAVQPSDYVNLREYLNLNEISKEIVIQPYSRRQFRAWFFNASEPVAYPHPEISALENIYSHEFRLPVKLTDWERAKYFGLFVQ